MCRERSFRRKKWNLLNDKKTEEETCQSWVCDEPFGNSRPGEKWASCTDCGKLAHEDCTSGDWCCLSLLLIWLMYLRLLSPCLVFGTINSLILTHINGASTCPGGVIFFCTSIVVINIRLSAYISKAVIIGCRCNRMCKCGSDSSVYIWRAVTSCLHQRAACKQCFSLLCG